MSVVETLKSVRFKNASAFKRLTGGYDKVSGENCGFLFKH